MLWVNHASQFLIYRRINQLMALGHVDQCCCVAHLEFVFDLGLVVGHGFEADVEFLGDGAVVLALAGEAEDFEFAVGEFSNR